MKRARRRWRLVAAWLAVAPDHAQAPAASGVAHACARGRVWPPSEPRAGSAGSPGQQTAASDYHHRRSCKPHRRTSRLPGRKRLPPGRSSSPPVRATAARRSASPGHGRRGSPVHFTAAHDSSGPRVLRQRRRVSGVPCSPATASWCRSQSGLRLRQLRHARRQGQGRRRPPLLPGRGRPEDKGDSAGTLTCVTRRWRHDSEAPRRSALSQAQFAKCRRNDSDVVRYRACRIGDRRCEHEHGRGRRPVCNAW